MRGPQPRAFSLMELLVVIVVLSLLSAFAVFAMRATVDRSVEAKQQTRMTSLLRATRALFIQASATEPSYTWEQALLEAVADLPEYRTNALAKGHQAVGGQPYSLANGWMVTSDTGASVYSSAPNDIVMEVQSGVLYVASRVTPTRGVFGMATAQTGVRTWVSGCALSSCDTGSIVTSGGPPPHGGYAPGTTAPGTTAPGTTAPSTTAPPAVIAGIVTTFAGSGTQGFLDTTGAQAQFSNPQGVAASSSGVVYVADTSNHRIRRVVAGVVSTFAGSGSVGSSNNASPALATFNQPNALAVSPTGDLAVVDAGNHRIRLISGQTGAVSTLAGSSAGYTDATGTLAQFNNPKGAAYDTAGNLYVADYGNHRIRKISPSGVVTTLAGSGTPAFADGTGTAASFNQPYALEVDLTGNILVADMSNHRIRQVTPSGVVTTLAGTGTLGSTDGAATSTARFNAPHDVAVDSLGNVYVTDTSSNKIRKIAGGVVSTLAGSTAGFSDATGAQAQFRAPWALAYSPTTNCLLVADVNNQRVRQVC